jgi:acyl-CoA synthetase (AMP-forming)/AMP-acid ligase II
MDGYLGLPGETAAKFADGSYRTGDVLRRDDDGWFHFVGRTDDMFVCAGENVYPGAVAQVLEEHPGVRQAAVVGVPDEDRGQIPVAFVVAAPGHAPTEADVQAWALARAPASHHPRAVWFLDELPVSGTEKIDAQGLAAEARRRLHRSTSTRPPARQY